MVRSIGQACTWYGGLSVTVSAVVRAGGSGVPGYSVDVRVVNGTPRGFATDALEVELWFEPGDRAARMDLHGGIGAGLGGVVAAPGGTVSGGYGFQAPAGSESGQVAVGIRPSPVAQQCLLQGSPS